MRIQPCSYKHDRKPKRTAAGMASYLLAAIQPTNTVNTAAKRRRQPDPDMFDGTRKQYQLRDGIQEQLLLSNSSLDENTKMMIFKKGLAYKLQDKLVGLKSKNLEEIQNRAIEIADQLYRMDLHTKGTKNRRREDRSPNKEHRSRHRSTSPVLEDRMEGVEYTGRSGKPRRLSKDISKTTERRKSRKAQKEELNSDEESSGVDT
ncbi:hypothetical protein P3342_004585 [Pyrenophora teres f. teres]|nr:hypothetical protein P3342_004585 [Pyrenophora teres f. teres]